MVSSAYMCTAYLSFQHSKTNGFFSVHAQQQVRHPGDCDSALLKVRRESTSEKEITENKEPQNKGTCYIWLAPHHAVHQDELELVLIEGLVSVLVVCCPDVAGDGRGDSGVGVAVAGVSQQRSLVVE